MMWLTVTTRPLLPGGGKVGMRGLNLRTKSRLLNPLTLPSPRQGEEN
jgi:hypothetical protein